MHSDIKKAVREQTHALISMSGPSGCGKTYSALLVALGLAGEDGKIGFIDTEAKRSRHYAELADFDVIDLAPPFTPARYIENIKKFEEAGYAVLIIDSTSHEWEGTGGVMEMAEGKNGLHAWNDPKAKHRKLMNHILQSQMHIIFCCRAREKMAQVYNVKKGKDDIVSQGIQPVVEKNFIFEMTVSMVLDEKTKIPELTKCPEKLLHAFPAGMMLSEETGKAIAAWANEGKAPDLKFEAMAREGREQANKGKVALREWYKFLPDDIRDSALDLVNGELLSIAEAHDEKIKDGKPPKGEADVFKPDDESEGKL